MRWHSAAWVCVMLGLAACGKKEAPAPGATPVEPAPATTPTATPATTPATTVAAAEDATTAPEPVDATVAAAPEDAAPATPAAEPAPVKAPAKRFHDMSDDEKGPYMKETVLPAMRERFQAYNPTEFAKVNCATCHGPNAKEKKFEMPSPDLPKLPTTPEGFKALAEEDPKAMAFMKDVVTPTMATLLGEELYNPETQKGFGCFACHTPEP